MVYFARIGDLIARQLAAEQEISSQGRRINAAADRIGEATVFVNHGFKRHAAHAYFGGGNSGLRYTGRFG